jgi:hypothetical protein
VNAPHHLAIAAHNHRDQLAATFVIIAGGAMLVWFLTTWTSIALLWIAAGLVIAPVIGVWSDQKAKPPKPTRCPKCGYVEATWRCRWCGTNKT